MNPVKPRRRLDRGEGSVMNPTVPFFGTIDYPVTEKVLRPVVARYPELKKTAARFVAAMRGEAARNRGFDFRHAVEDDVKADELPPLSVLEEDVRKWKAFLASGLKLTLARYRGVWVGLTGTGMIEREFSNPLEIRPGSKQQTFSFGGIETSVAQTLPEGWRDVPWLYAWTCIDCFEVMGDAVAGAVWQPDEQAWRYGSAAEIEAAGLSHVYADFVADLHGRKRPDRGSRVGKPSRATLNAVFLASGTVVVAERTVQPPLCRVDLDGYHAALRLYLAERTIHYGRYFEFGLRKFANDVLVTPGMPALGPLVNAFLARMPTVFEAKRFGPEHDDADGQLKTVLAALHAMPVTAGFPVSVLPERHTARDRYSGHGSSPVEREAQDASEKERNPDLLDRQAVERLRTAYGRDPDAALKGAFWRQWQPEFEYEDGEPAETGSTVLAKLAHLPTDEVIAAAVAFRPDAEPLMANWRGLWDRSFPGWLDADRSRRPASRTESNREWLRKAVSGDRRHMSASTVSSIDYALSREGGEGVEDWRGAIQDASLAVTIAHECAPRAGLMMTPSGTCIVDGLDREGLPLLEDAIHSVAPNRPHYRLQQRKFDFWNWPFLLPHTGRTLVKAGRTDFAALVLLDMKLHGHDTAVVTNFSVWHKVDLAACDRVDELGKLLWTLFESPMRWECLFVTESLPVSCRQRFFVVDGRVVGSSCLDPRLTALDAATTRLEERVGVRGAKRSETAAVRRVEAGALARKARAIARDLRENGILECAMDVGMTGRGPVLDWLMPVDGAALGTLSPSRYVDAFRRKREGLKAGLRDDLLARIDRLATKPWLNEKCREVLDRNFFHLVTVVERQYDILPHRSLSPDRCPSTFMEATAVSVILTALLETPPGSRAAEETET